MSGSEAMLLWREELSQSEILPTAFIEDSGNKLGSAS